MKTRSTLLATLLPLLLATTLSACGGTPADTAGGDANAATALTGLFRIDPGDCGGEEPSGSYFRMVQPGGDTEAGPFVTNGDSTCADPSITPLTPGADGGLRSGTHQPAPEPAFDEAGNARAAAIAQPAKWFAVAFGLASNPTDPQTGLEVEAPIVTASGGELSADLRALAAAWNGQHFNQGSPKPDGSVPGNTAPASGTYDGDTGRYTLEWASQIEGGPFDNFTGIWHLEGVFDPAG